MDSSRGLTLVRNLCCRDRRDERIRDGGGGGRRGRGGRGRKEDYSDEDDLYGGYKPRKRQGPPVRVPQIDCTAQPRYVLLKYY